MGERNEECWKGRRPEGGKGKGCWGFLGTWAVQAVLLASAGTISQQRPSGGSVPTVADPFALLVAQPGLRYPGTAPGTAPWQFSKGPARCCMSQQPLPAECFMLSSTTFYSIICSATQECPNCTKASGLFCLVPMTQCRGWQHSPFINIHAAPLPLHQGFSAVLWCVFCLLALNVETPPLGLAPSPCRMSRAQALAPPGALVVQGFAQQAWQGPRVHYRNCNRKQNVTELFCALDKFLAKHNYRNGLTSSTLSTINDTPLAHHSTYIESLLYLSALY